MPVQKIIVRLPATLEKTGISRSAVYAKIDPKHKHYDPAFPRPIKLGARGIGWVESELQIWIDSRIAARG